MDAASDAETCVARENVGCVKIEDYWVSCERVVGLNEWIRRKVSGQSRDARLCSDTRDSTGSRVLDAPEALNAYSDANVPGWSFGDTPKVAVEFLESLRSSVQSLTTHHCDFEATSASLPPV